MGVWLRQRGPARRDGGPERVSRARGRVRDERGAVAVFSAFILVVLLGVTALVVDIGMQRVARSDMQSLADVVALDLAREIRGGRTQAQLAAAGNFSSSQSAVSRSVARNEGTFGEVSDVQVDWGSYENKVWDTTTDPPSAVRVTTTAAVDYSVKSGEGDVTRTAIAVASTSACYRLGTFVTAIHAGNEIVLDPLNDMLGVNLGLVSYRALADAHVSMEDLAAAPTIGSPEQLLLGTVTYSDLIRAAIHALRNEPGPTASAAVSALEQILNASSAVGSINVGNVLHAVPTDLAALAVRLNVLDLVASARLANGQYLLQIPNLNASVPGVGSQFDATLALVSAAQLACGKPNTPESVAKNAQLEGGLGVEFVNLPTLNLAQIGTLQTAKGVGMIRVDMGDGTGQLVEPPEVYCGEGNQTDPHTYSVTVSTDLASYHIVNDLIVNGELKLSVLNKLGLGGGLSGGDNSKHYVEVGVRLTVGTTRDAGSSMANLRIPPNDVTPVQTGTEVHLDPNTLVASITSVKIGGTSRPIDSATSLTGPILDELTWVGNSFFEKTVTPLIDNINDSLIGPVVQMAGLRFGGADVYAVGAVCGLPALRD